MPFKLNHPSGVATSERNDSLGAFDFNLTMPLGQQFEHQHCLIALQLVLVHLLSRMLPEFHC